MYKLSDSLTVYLFKETPGLRSRDRAVIRTVKEREKKKKNQISEAEAEEDAFQMCSQETRDAVSR